MIVSAFLQPPGLPLLRGGVIAVVMQKEGPHLATDGWVNTTEEDGLAKSEKTVSTTERDHNKADVNRMCSSLHLTIPLLCSSR